MKHLETLVVSKNTTTPKILNWKVSVVHKVEAAIEKLQQRPYKVVAIASEIAEMDQAKLKQITPLIAPHVMLVAYSTDALLAETVKTAYWSKNKPGAVSNYLDNSFEIKLANSLQSKKQ